MCCQCQVMTVFHIERKVHTEIIGYTITVSIRIEHLSCTQFLVIILSCRNCSRTTGTIIHVQRQTITTGKLIITHQLEIMRFVIFSRIPVTAIYRFHNTTVFLTKECARISIVYPTVQLTLRLLHLKFYPVCITFGIDVQGLEG